MQGADIILFIKKMLLSVLLWLLILYVILIVGARLLENSLIYYPTRYPRGRWEPSNFGLEVEDIFLITDDGVRIHGWYAKAKGGKRIFAYAQSYEATSQELGEQSEKVILLFHGNGGNITDRIEKIKFLLLTGASVFCIDYRGYGKSEGKPNEEGIYNDGIAAYKYLTNTRKIAPERIFLMGESLGGAVAVEVASKFPAAGLILESTMINARSLAIRTMPILPPSFYLRTKFDNIGKLKKLRIPTLIIYGTEDTTIPPSHSRKLFEAANGPKKLIAIEGAGHNDVFLVGWNTYLKALIDILNQ